MSSIRKKSFAAEQLALRQQKKVSPVVWVLVGAVVVALVVSGYMMYQRSAAEKQVETEAEQIMSIAVLPFVDMSPNKDQEHLGEGIAEAILNALTNIGELKVIARGSSFKYIGEYEDVKAIGDNLGVESVLEGSVLKSENKIRVTAQLIRVSDNSHLFSRKYDYEWQDIFTLQDSISLEVLKELKFTLMGKEKATIVKRYTNDPDAWELYLQGRYFAELDQLSWDKAREHFQQAIDKDPKFALAYLGLAFVTGQEDFLNRALELDDTLGEAYALLAMISLGNLDFPAAHERIKRALELNPGYYWSYDVYSRYLRAMGRYEEALDAEHKAQELNPLPWFSYGQAISLYLRLGKYDEARNQFKKAMELNLDNEYAKYHLARIDYLTGNYEKAIEFWQGKFRDPDNERTSPLRVAYIQALSGNRDKAEEILQEQIIDSSTGEDCYNIALVYTALGDRDNAFIRLETAYEKRFGALMYLKADPEWDPLHSDPRFKELTDKIGLP